MSQENTRRAESILNEVANFKTENNTVSILAATSDSSYLASLPADHHILPYSWSIWHHSRSKPSVAAIASDESSPAVDSYLQTTKKIEYKNFYNNETTTDIYSIEQLWSILTILKNPFQLAIGSEFLIFKKNVKPVWEDPINTKGGRWVFRFSRRLNNNNGNSNSSGSNSNQDLLKIRRRSSLIWERLLLRTLGGSLISKSNEYSSLLLNDIQGLVLSVRKDEDIISVWNSNLNFNKKNQSNDETETEDAGSNGRKRDRKLNTFLARRIICDSILRVIRECDLILQGSDIIETVDSGSNDRVYGVSFEYRLHSENNNSYKESSHNSTHSNTHNSHSSSHSNSNSNSSSNHNHTNSHTHNNGHKNYNRRYKFKESKENNTETTIDKLINTNDSNFFSNLGRRRNDDDASEMGLMSFGKRRLQQQKERFDESL